MHIQLSTLLCILISCNQCQIYCILYFNEMQSIVVWCMVILALIDIPFLLKSVYIEFTVLFLCLSLPVFLKSMFVILWFISEQVDLVQGFELNREHVSEKPVVKLKKYFRKESQGHCKCGWSLLSSTHECICTWVIVRIYALQSGVHQNSLAVIDKGTY